jgi:hypothetical protein
MEQIKVFFVSYNVMSKCSTDMAVIDIGLLANDMVVPNIYEEMTGFQGKNKIMPAQRILTSTQPMAEKVDRVRAKISTTSQVQTDQLNSLLRSFYRETIDEQIPDELCLPLSTNEQKN